MTKELSYSSLIIQAQLAQIEQEQGELRSQYGLPFYRPHKKQDMFHRAADFKYRFMRSGNRFGKSQMGAAEDCAWLLGERPWCDESDPGRYVGIPKHAVKLCLVVTDWDKSEEIFTSQVKGDRRGKLFQYLPEDRIVRKVKGSNGKICQIWVKSKWGGESVLYIETIKSFKQDGLSVESSDWDGVHFDEPPPEAMWIAISRGLMDRGGKAWFTCTLVREMWVNHFFLPSLSVHPNNEPYIKGQKWALAGSSRDNPHLTEVDIAEYEGTLTEAEKRCRIDGLPMDFSGLIYPQFNESKLYRGAPFGWDSPLEPPKMYTIRVAIDVHPKTQQAVLFAATSPQGHVYFYYEIFQHLMIPELAVTVRELLKGRFVTLQMCDPLAWIPNPVDGTTMATSLIENGLIVQKAPKDLMRGVHETQKFLQRNDVFFGEHLVNTIREFETFVWDPDKEKPGSRLSDHMMENLYRLVISGLHYVDPTNPDVSPIKPVKVPHGTRIFHQSMESVKQENTRMSRSRRYPR